MSFAAIHDIQLKTSKNKYLFLHLLLLVITKKFELVWNMSSITVELSKVGFWVLDVLGLNLHNQRGDMN